MYTEKDKNLPDVFRRMGIISTGSIGGISKRIS